MKKVFMALGSSIALCIGLTGCKDGPSAAAPPDSVVASITPSSSVNTKVGQTSLVTVSFVTSDDSPLAKTNLSIASGLTNLPAGWTLSSNTCSSLNATASSCQINLAFAPSTIESGNLSLNYSFVNNQNVLSQKTLTINYIGTVNNNARYTVSPVAPLRAMSGFGHSYPVTVNFTTDDGNVATDLTIPPSILPTGWKFGTTPSSTTPLCTEFGAGKPCVLQLTYTPATYNSVPLSTLSIPFSYNAEDGQAKTGSATYTYSAGTNDAVIANITPSNAYNTHVNIPANVTLNFTTNDQNQASNLQLTNSSLPAGWSTISPLTCPNNKVPSQNSGSACTATLQYFPLTSGLSGTLNLPYTYTANDGRNASGSIPVPYTSLASIFAYAVDITNHAIQACKLYANGVLSYTCQPTTLSGTITTLDDPTNIAFNTVSSGEYVYIANVNNSDNITYCQLDPSGTAFQSCNDFHDGNFVNPGTVTFHINSVNNITYAYISNVNSNISNQYAVLVCPIDPVTGAPGACSEAIGLTSQPSYVDFQKVQSTVYAYITEGGVGAGPAQYCQVDDTDNTFTNCQSTNSPGTPEKLAFETINGNLYAYLTDYDQISSSTVYQCKVNTDGSFSSCINANTEGTAFPSSHLDGIAFQTLGNDPSTAKTYMYLSNAGMGSGGAIFQCPIDSASELFSQSQCNTNTNDGTLGTLTSLAVHYYNSNS